MWRQQARPHGEEVADPLRMEPFDECVHALMLACVCVCVCVCVCACLHGARQTLGSVQAVSAGHSLLTPTKWLPQCTHTNTHTRAQTHAHTDHICHWQGYYSLSCVFYDPPFFSSFWSIRFLSPMQNNEDVIAGTSERSNVICVNVVGTLEHIAA